MKKWGWILLIIGVFLGLRFFRLKETVNFSADQGMFLIRAREIWENKELTLIGPTASPIVEGRQFFQGAAIYYFLVVLMLISRWDPIIASGWLIVLNLVGLYFVGKISKKAVILATFMPVSVYYSKFIWNPNVLMILAPIYWWIFLKSIKDEKWIDYGISGLLAGVMLQFHFQVGLLILVCAGYILLKKTNWKNTVIYLIGVAIGYFPLILFDLRNNFYNLKTIWLWITKGQSQKTPPQIYYFLVWLPLLWVYLVKIIEKTKVKKWIYGGLIVGSLIWLIGTKGTRDMPKNWDYKMLEKSEKIILSENPDNFNIVNKLSGDTRFYSLRYLLEKDNQAAMPVDKYPEAKVLFVVADWEWKSDDDKVWEVSSLGKSRELNRWELGSGINLYKLVKYN